MYIYISVAVALIGLIIYGLSATPKPAEVGRLMFACGLLAFLLLIAGGHTIALPK